MKILFWLGVILFGQALAYLPYHALFERRYFYLSIGIGLIGLLILILAKRKKDSMYEEDGLYPNQDIEYLGSQSINLVDRLDHDPH